jgi:hypothetical protein
VGKNPRHRVNYPQSYFHTDVNDFPDRLLKGNKSVKLNMSLSISTFYVIIILSISRCKDTQIIPFHKILFQFGFDFFDRGERGAEVIRKSLAEFIVGHTYRFGYVSQRILGFDAVFCAAQQQTNGFVVTLSAKNVVDGGAVKVQFADIFGLEFRVL